MRERGFTLAELLVGLVVLSLAAVLMLQGVAGIAAMTRRADAGARDTGTVAAAQMILRERIERLNPINTGNTSKPIADVVGNERALDFTGAPPPDAGFDAMQSYRLRLAPTGDLMLYRASISDDRINLGSPSLRGWTGATLLRGVTAISLAYYGDAGNRTGVQWQSFWRQRPTPPELVRLRVSFAAGDRRVWPALVIRPTASSAPPCRTATGSDCPPAA